MVSVRHFGIKYANDLTGKYREYIVDSVDLLSGQPYAAIDGSLLEEAYA